MRVTRITPENSEYFENLIPKGLLEDENLFWQGAIDGDGTACAILGAGICKEMAYIEWLYTHPDYRGRGAARDLLRSLRALLKKIRVEILQVSFSDEEENLEDFLEEEGFLINDDSEMYSVPIRDLLYSRTSERLDERKDDGDNVVFFSKIMNYYEFYDYLRERGIPLSGSAEGIYKYSLVRLDKERNITGFMLVGKKPGGDLEIPYMENDGSLSGVSDIFRALKKLVLEHRWEDASLVFFDRAGNAVEFVEQVTEEDREGFIVDGQKQGVRVLTNNDHW